MHRQLIVMSHHKCATNWIGNYMKDYCNMNNLKYFYSHLSDGIPQEDEHLCLLANANYDFISQNVNKGLHVIRNPLSVILSAYYSHKTSHSLNGWPELARQRDILEKADSRDGMFLTLAFLEKDDFYKGAVGPLYAMRHWNYSDERYQTVRMEDIVAESDQTIRNILSNFLPNGVLPSVNNHTFEAISGREKGVIDDSSHYRAGNADQWKSELPSEIIEYVKSHFSTLVEKFYPEIIT